MPSARSSVLTGVLHGELNWAREVRLAGDVILAEDARLTIEPGTVVRFLPPEVGAAGLVDHPHFPGSELIVKGRLLAIGRPEAPIVFEADEAGAAPGAWGAVNLEGSPEAVFENCIFRQADSAVHSRNSRVFIAQSLFERNLVGIRFHDSEILIENNLLRNNGTGIRFHFGAPVICSNRFERNRVNLFITAYPRDYRIEQNFFGPTSDYQVVLGEEVPDDVQLPRNAWPSDDVTLIYDRIYDGRRSAYLGRVRLEPILGRPPRDNGLSWNP